MPEPAISRPAPGRAEGFLAQVRALRRRRRHRLLLEGLVRGALIGSAAGALLAGLAGTIRLPLAAALAAACAAAVGAAAGILAGLLRRIDTRLLLISADRSLGSRELAGTAWDIVRSGSGSRSLFREAILHDAARLLAAARPGDVLGPPRLRLLPFIPAAALLIAAATLFPFDLGKLFGPRSGPDREMAVLGEELENLGRRIEASSRELDTGRGLELSRDLAQLGRDLQDRSVEPGEALERVESLQRRLAQEYGLRLLRMPGGDARQGTPSGGTGAEPSENGRGAGGGEKPPSGSDPPSVDKGSEELADAMKRLDELKDRAGRRGDADAESSRARGGGGSTRRQGARDPGQDGADGSGSAPGGGAEGMDSGAPERNARSGAPERNARSGAPERNARSGAPGDAPVPDQRAAEPRIAAGSDGTPLRAESTSEAAGEAMKLLVRSLPGWSAAKTPEQRILREYQRQAETALAREEVPAELRVYVKDYFTAIGMAPAGR
jgi:hypothetical protein